MTDVFEYNATLIRRTNITDTLCIMQIKSDVPIDPFKAGQFTMIGLKPQEPRCPDAGPEDVKRKPTDAIIRRAYSIASDPAQTQYYELYLSLVKTGELTSRLYCLKEGSRIWNSGKPAGLFTLDSLATEKGLFMISTGTGIAPFMSMFRQAKREKSKRKIIILNAIDVSNQLGYRSELEAAAKENPNFRYLPVVTFPNREPTWKGLTGWVQDDIRKGMYEKTVGWEITPDTFQVLLCGNPAMIKSAIEAFTEKGFRHGKSKDSTASIYTEEFW